MKALEFFLDYISTYIPYKNKWNYEDGVVMEGAWKLYQVTGNLNFKKFIVGLLNQKLDEDGTLLNYAEQEYNIDNIKSGTTLLYLLKEYPQFQNGIEQLYRQIENHPRNLSGSFFHKKIYPYQVWLDGAYMVLPFYSQYVADLKEEKDFSDIFLQFRNIKKFLYSKETGLYFHGYDEKKREKWANILNGQSECFWLRSIGWLTMALIDSIEIIRPFQTTIELEEMLIDLLFSLRKYYDEKEEMWFQVVDQRERDGNYPEVSGTAMICYSILKSIRLKVLEDLPLKKIAYHALEKIEDKYLVENKLTGICGVAGLGNTPYRDGSYQYYIQEPKIDNDPKGVGAFMMAYSEYLKNRR